MPAPGQFLPRKSGAHRIACIALYRALLIQCPKIPLPDEIQFPGTVNPIKHFIRKRFKKNAFHASPRIVVLALKTGYAAEQLLRSAAQGHGPSITQIHDMLRTIHAKSTHSRTTTPPMPPRPPRPERYPNAPKMLDIRPLPLKKLPGGVRHVPTMTFTDFLPFLRFKSPQSPFLSRVLRQKLRTKQKRLDLAATLEDELAMGEMEEEWEANLRFPYGMEEVRGREGVDGRARRVEGVGERRTRDGKRVVLRTGDYVDEDGPWQMQSWVSRGQVYTKMVGEVEKAQRLGVRMLGAVDRERELWILEREERRAKREETGAVGGDGVEVKVDTDGQDVDGVKKVPWRPLSP